MSTVRRVNSALNSVSRCGRCHFYLSRLIPHADSPFGLRMFHCRTPRWLRNGETTIIFFLLQYIFFILHVVLASNYMRFPLHVLCVLLSTDMCARRLYWSDTSVFQLGIFLSALRPARTVLHHARFAQRPAELKTKIMLFFFDIFSLLFTKHNCCFCVFSRCKNACKMLADLCPCFHRLPTKLCPDLASFACWISICDQILVVHA